MNEKDNFALVPRPPSAVEKAEPGAKLILSGMVADTLAIAWQKTGTIEAIFRRGLESQKRGEHAQAFRFYKQAAESGHPYAQYKLGNCYLYGEGVSQSENDGISWLEKALDHAIGMAGFVLGNHFWHLLLPNYPEAIKYHRRAVDLGYNRGVSNLANILERLGHAGETPRLKNQRSEATPKLAMSWEYDAWRAWASRKMRRKRSGGSVKPHSWVKMQMLGVTWDSCWKRARAGQ